MQSRDAVSELSPEPVAGVANAPPVARTSRLRALGALAPFVRPYALRIVLSIAFLLLAAASTLILPAVLRELIDRGFVAAEPGARIMAIRGHFFALFAVSAAFATFAAARFYMVSWLGERVTADLRNAVYGHVLRQSPAFFEHTQLGEVIARLTTDTTVIQTMVGSSLSIGLRNAVLAVGALGMLALRSSELLVPVVGVFLLVVLPATFLGRRLRRLGRASQDRVADASAVADEVLHAVPVVQSYTQESREHARFRAASERAFETALRRTRVRSLMMTFMITSTFAAVLFSLYRGTEAVIRGEISAGLLGQTVVYAMMFATSLAALAEVYGDLLRAAGAAERLFELLATESPIVSPPSPRALAPAQRGSSVRFDAVTFFYPSRPEQPALSGFSLDIAAGETVALVGPSGAGKSTVFQLLLRFYDPSRGELTVDGVSVKEASLGELRARIGVVPQESAIFSSSILENIRYGRPEAGDEEVYAAAKAAFADEFITRLPLGYHTFVGERGVRLSGGQRQRLSIARAMLKDAPLLLLDEATSALDAESERMVQAALATAMRGRTTLVIAHRLATVQRADRIVVMDGGQIVDSGAHAELVARDGLYARLAALQFGS